MKPKKCSNSQKGLSSFLIFFQLEVSTHFFLKILLADGGDNPPKTHPHTDIATFSQSHSRGQWREIAQKKHWDVHRNKVRYSKKNSSNFSITKVAQSSRKYYLHNCETQTFRNSALNISVLVNIPVGRESSIRLIESTVYVQINMLKGWFTWNLFSLPLFSLNNKKMAFFVYHFF